jgi:hypothetical protein
MKPISLGARLVKGFLAIVLIIYCVDLRASSAMKLKKKVTSSDKNCYAELYAVRTDGANESVVRVFYDGKKKIST